MAFLKVPPPYVVALSISPIRPPKSPVWVIIASERREDTYAVAKAIRKIKLPEAPARVMRGRKLASR
jgi:hypothetical protein